MSRIKDISSSKKVLRDTAITCLYGFLFSFICCGFLVSLYRFPIPLFAYASGCDKLFEALIGLIMYHVLGLFILIALSIYMVVIICNLVIKRNSDRFYYFSIYVSASLLVIFYLFILSILDKIIGPW